MSDIDFVVLWVDSDDRCWQDDFIRYKTIYSDTYKLAVTPSRFRDMGLFKYWFRAVENYAPWVRKVHLVTCGQVPSWLDKSYHKINLVRHSDIIDKEYLPTFNSRAIEVNIHKIKGLSDQFVYFNDDMLLNSPITPEFYFKKNLPNDFLIENDINPITIDNNISNLMLTTNASVINTFFNRRESIKKNITKYYNLQYGRYIKKNISKKKARNFTGFFGRHLPQPFLKSTFEEVWSHDEIRDILVRTSKSRFRDGYNLNQYIFRYWHLASGKFNPCNPKRLGSHFNLTGDRQQLDHAIQALKSDVPQICLNDDLEDNTLFEFACQKVSDTLRCKLGKTSKFEIEM